MIIITPLRQFQFPVTAECINPSVFQDKSMEEIAALEVWEGNRKKILGDLFKIQEDPTETPNIILNGEASQVRKVGIGMEKGEIEIYGNVGMHVGEKMRGGKITVRGDAAGWAGSNMKGGLIEILGNAADYLASPYRGSSGGMSKGKIIVHGNAGSDVAVFMKGGLIKIHGSAGPFLGFRMRGGTIHVEKNVGRRVAACMTGGKIVVSGSLDDIPPTFTINGIKPKVKIEEGEKAIGPYYVFLGDRAEEGKGKLFVSKETNPKLKKYEKFL